MRCLVGVEWVKGKVDVRVFDWSRVGEGGSG